MQHTNIAVYITRINLMNTDAFHMSFANKVIGIVNININFRLKYSAKYVYAATN